jgi:hypothetical protein
MKNYDVTIKATITKTYSVQADDVDTAYELAHEKFSVLNDDTPEHYEQETVNIKEEKKCKN